MCLPTCAGRRASLPASDLQPAHQRGLGTFCACRACCQTSLEGRSGCPIHHPSHATLPPLPCPPPCPRPPLYNRSLPPSSPWRSSATSSSWRSMHWLWTTRWLPRYVGGRGSATVCRCSPAALRLRPRPPPLQDVPWLCRRTPSTQAICFLCLPNRSSCPHKSSSPSTAAAAAAPLAAPRRRRVPSRRRW